MRDYVKVGPPRIDEQSLRVEASGQAKRPGYRTPAPFMEKVFEAVRKIPAGKTMTYKQVAEKAGVPYAYRAVGNLLSKNYDPQIPCHRVIRSDGSLGGYNRGAKWKHDKLKSEGAHI